MQSSTTGYLPPDAMYSRQNGHGGQYPVAAPPGSESAPAPASANHGGMPGMPMPNPNSHLRPYCGSKAGRAYSLKVEQQPIRARMCGFGDKDRRPITPPPCIRLVVTDVATGNEIPYDDIDSTFFVLTVDLWDQEGSHEVNLVRHSSGAPTVSISSSTTTSYPPPQEMARVPAPMYMMATYGDPYRQNPHQPGNPYGAPPPMAGGYYAQSPAAPGGAQGFQYPPVTMPGMPGYAMPMGTVAIPPPPATATGMFTRNLIGSLTVNAFRLVDVDQKPGFWFVLQDLSVRTEGMFRLKMNFVDVGSGQGTNALNTGRAPVLATCFSEVFQVYSAKKFPGVIESTPLSKCFAGQGIKIPIRKDGPKPLSNQAEYDADD